MIVPGVFLVYIFGNFVQGAAGFGSALVSMPLLVALLGLSTAAPVFALTGVVGSLMMLIRYRTAFEFNHVRQLMVGTLVGIPIGGIGAGIIDEQIVLFILGVFTAGYGIYALAGLTVPRIHNPGYGYGFGLIAGIIGGAYNASGPPYVIYGNAQRWSPQEFKSNLQGIFLIGTAGAATFHILNGNVTTHVLVNFLVALPGMIIGLYIGYRVDRYINAATFRKGVLVLLIILGLSMIL